MVPVAKRSSEFEADPFTWAELTKVLLALDPADRPPFLFWAFTGVRTGELIGLRWKRVDLINGAAHIEETTTLGKDKQRPKTKAGIRDFKLLPAAVQALEDELRVGERCSVSDERVFQRPTSRTKDHAWGYNPGRQLEGRLPARRGALPRAVPAAPHVREPAADGRPPADRGGGPARPQDGRDGQPELRQVDRHRDAALGEVGNAAARAGGD